MDHESSSSHRRAIAPLLVCLLIRTGTVQASHSFGFDGAEAGRTSSIFAQEALALAASTSLTPLKSGEKVAFIQTLMRGLYVSRRQVRETADQPESVRSGFLTFPQVLAVQHDNPLLSVGIELFTEN